MHSEINPYQSPSPDADGNRTAYDPSSANASRSSRHVVPALFAGLVGFAISLAVDKYFGLSSTASWFVQGVMLSASALAVSLVIPLPPIRSSRRLQIILPSLEILGLWSVTAAVDYIANPGWAYLTWCVGLLGLIHWDRAVARRNRPPPTG